MPKTRLTACTAEAPTGSSILSFESMKTAATMTSTPAMAPMSAAAQAETNAHGAVMATRPASMRLASELGSALPHFTLTYAKAAKAPVALAIMVLVATTASRVSMPERVEPALKPNQPNARMNVPSMTCGMLCGAMGWILPSGVYFPARGPIILPITMAATPPVMCTTELPAKSTWPWPSPKFAPSCESQPPPQTQFAYTG